MSNIGNFGVQGVTLSPKFIFGINGAIKKNLYIYDDKKLLYVAGHNVVIFNPEELTQVFIPGSEGTECINFITMSPAKKFLAICEKGEVRAQCTIVNMQTKKRQKVIPEQDQEVDYKTKEFLGVAFCPKDEKRHMVTLCGDPDWCVLLWQHDIFKMLARIDLGIVDPPAGGTFQISEFNVSTHLVVAVTGPGCFKFMKVNDSMNGFNTLKDTLSYKDESYSMMPSNVSDNYTCHSFDRAGKLHVCTDHGEIMICDHDGNLQYYLKDAPLGNRIECIYPASRGLIVAGVNGYIWSFEMKNFDYGAPYAKLQDKIGTEEKSQPSALDTIHSLCLSEPEDQIYVVNRNNQLLTVKFSYDREIKGTEQPKLKPLHTLFHSTVITGMDICLRKQLIVTTSNRHIFIWNYHTKNLDVQFLCQAGEEAQAVAFHPSGFHIVVAFQDKIQFMNVLSNTVKEYSPSLQLKGCREIKFSNGGHMFAAAVGPGAIYIYNFYTQECPQYMQLKGHNGKVRCIDWSDDDMGLVSCGQDGAAFFYDLAMQKEQQTRINEKDFTLKGVQLTGLCNIPGMPQTALAVGNDKHIWRTCDSNSKANCDTKYIISQVAYLASGKAFFAGVGEDNHPGSIQIYKSSLEKIHEIQAHGKGIERMRISFDNNYLFTAGRDGTLIIHDIKDKDPRGGVIKREFEKVLGWSEDILTEKSEMEEFDNQKEQLENELLQAKDPASTGVDNKTSHSLQEQEIGELQEELSQSQLNARQKYEQLQTAKQDMEDNYVKQLKLLSEQQNEELQARQQEMNAKMLDDAAKYQELQQQLETDQNAFATSQQKIYEEHTNTVNLNQKNHNDFVEKQRNLIHKLRQEIETMKRDNEEMMLQITQDAKTEYEEIERKSQTNLFTVNEMQVKAKAELQNCRNKLGEVESEIDTLTRQIQDKKLQLTQQKSYIDTLKHQINEQQKEIHEKDTQIGDRERQIYQLKKKTQELEKFKFVLDYKIKDLKRDIAPREANIDKLKIQTQTMDEELKTCNTVNDGLGYTVNTLRDKQEEMQELIKASRIKIRKNDIYIQSFKTAIYWVVQHIDDHDQLKKAVQQSLYGFVKDQQLKNVEIDADIKKEYSNQRKYLESSKHSLEKRLEKEEQIHKMENQEVMEENMKLINQIQQLRKHVQEAATDFKNLNNSKRKEDNDKTASGADGTSTEFDNTEMAKHMDNTAEHEQETIFSLKREADMKRRYIAQMQQTLQQKFQEAQVLAQQFEEAMNSGQNN